MDKTKLQIWSPEDIKHALQAVYTTMEATAANFEHNARSDIYYQGFEDALHCVAKSFGIELSMPGDARVSKNAEPVP